MVETVNNQTRSVGRAVRRPYSDSEESDNDVLYVEEYDSTVQQVNLRNEWLTQTTVDSWVCTVRRFQVVLADRWAGRR